MVVANEIDRKRVQVLADNVRKWGTGNVAVTCGDAAMAARMESWYDVVAVDAPCSGEGMFRKDDEARGEWSVQNVRLCAERGIPVTAVPGPCAAMTALTLSAASSKSR